MSHYSNLFAAALGLSLVACIPTSARTNARIEPGFDLALVGGGKYISEENVQDNQEDGDPAKVLVFAELHAQGAWRLGDHDVLAVQLKVPLLFLYSTLDLFYQLPTESKTFFIGVGAEVSLASGIYMVLTHYVTDNIYLSITPRVLFIKGVNPAITPQVSIGMDNDVIDIAAFINYMHFFGEGIDIYVDSKNDTTDLTSFHKDAVIGGASFRF